MLASSLLTLALSSAAVIAAPATSAAKSYKPCTVVNDAWKVKFGRTDFAVMFSGIFVNNLRVIDDRGVDVVATTAVLNQDPDKWVSTPGSGLLLTPAPGASKLGPMKLAISYQTGGASNVAYVETLKGETCVVSGSDKWTKVDAISNAEEKDRPLIDCQSTSLKAGERYTDPNTETAFEKGQEEGHYESSNSMSTDPKARIPALSLHMTPKVGVFIEQDPAYEKISKIAIEYLNFRGQTITTFVIANKVPTLKGDDGTINARIYHTGYCKVQASETWASIKSVKLVA